MQDNKCKCESDKCNECPNVALNKTLCTQCANNYYPKENDPLNLGDYINCYNELEGYYLDNGLYKKCNDTCKTCGMKELCTKCANNYFPMENDPLNIGNNFICYNEIDGYYLDNESSLFKKCYNTCETYVLNSDEVNQCASDNTCPEEYSTLIEDKNDSINNQKFEKEQIQNLILNIINHKNITEEGNKIYNEIIKKIEEIFTSNYDTSIIDNRENDIIITDKMNITLSSTTNQKKI